MVKSWGRNLLEPLLIILGIVLVSASSGLFLNQSFSLFTYWDSLFSVFKDIVNPAGIVYVNSDVERNLFPIIFLAFYSSVRIVLLALVIAISVSLLILVIYYSAGKWFRGLINSFAFLISSLPDIFVISIMQIFVIWFFKQSGILLMDVASIGEKQIILFPAAVLSIVPAFFFLGLMVSFIKEEQGLPYVELARGKGLGKFRLLFIHMIRNILISLTYHAKQIVWMMLSNLLILEYLFNVFGVTSFLFTYNTPSIFAITAILLFIPIYILLKGLQFLIKRRIGKEMSL
ncbi:ABC transporter permease subunit [Bacillus salacetis]|uniref:ABC transporter permease subunit n=1 Tax=Bacillus salacetis TaxID=2315464 RepID=A0A3A1R7N5_9BACI|nr:ABC transporter permease subunit [Bacillus salacetis]RIW37343.1 ABC transporter permease subunit [Bacillus salacetis]